MVAAEGEGPPVSLKAARTGGEWGGWQSGGRRWLNKLLETTPSSVRVISRRPRPPEPNMFASVGFSALRFVEGAAATTPRPWPIAGPAHPCTRRRVSERTHCSHWKWLKGWVLRGKLERTVQIRLTNCGRTSWVRPLISALLGVLDSQIAVLFWWVISDGKRDAVT